MYVILFNRGTGRPTIPVTGKTYETAETAWEATIKRAEDQGGPLCHYSVCKIVPLRRVETKVVSFEEII